MKRAICGSSLLGSADKPMELSPVTSDREEAAAIRNRLATLAAEQAALRERLAELDADHANDHSPSLDGAPVTASSSPAEKIVLFRSLFRGREDVFSRRWTNARSGRSGYAPACANEWAPRICEKPRIKCRECPNRAFIPVSDEVIGRHLRGRDADGKDDLTEEAGRRGRVLGVRLPVVEDEDEAPWLAPPSRRKPDTSITDLLPETVEVVLGDQVYVDRTGLPASLVNRLARLPAGPTPWCWCIDGNSSTSGSRGWAASSIFVPMRSVGSVEASARRPVSSTSPSYRVSSAKERWTTSSPTTGISWSTSVTTCRRSASRRWRAAARLGTSSACPRR